MRSAQEDIRATRLVLDVVDPRAREVPCLLLFWSPRLQRWTYFITLGVFNSRINIIVYLLRFFIFLKLGMECGEVAMEMGYRIQLIIARQVEISDF